MIMNEPKRFHVVEPYSWLQRTLKGYLIIEPLKRVLYRTF